MVFGSQHLARVSVMTAIAAALTACVPTPEPSPSPTSFFATEDEAYDTAEKTYRAYTRALNAVDTSDPGSIDAVLNFTTGDFKTRDRENLSTMHAEGYRLTGNSRILSFRGVGASRSLSEITAEVCVDVRDTDLIDEAGASLVPEERPDVVAALIKFEASEMRVLISRASDSEEIKCPTP